MQFVILGLDGTDNEASERRSKARPAHIAEGDRLLALGNLKYGAALLHDDGAMKGSLYVVDFDSEEALNTWLQTEPYITGEVWSQVTVHKSNTRNPWQFNTPVPEE